MSVARGLIAGGLALTALDVVLKRASAVGGAFAFLAAAVNHWVSPTVPLIPDLRTKKTSTSSALDSTPTPTTPTTTTTQPIPA